MSQYNVLYSESIDSPKIDSQIIVSKVTLTVVQEHQQFHWLLEEVDMYMQDGILIIQHPSNGLLYISDAQLISQLEKSYKLYKKMNWGIPVVYMSILVKILGFIVIIGFIIWFFFRSIVPWMGEKAAAEFPKEYELQLGELMFGNLQKTLKIDTAKSKILQNFYNELGYEVDYPIKLHWVEEPIVNAFAVPGGNVVIYSGIIDKMKSPEELAALIGHEVSHIAFKHSLKGIFRDAANAMWWTIITGGNAGIVGVIAKQSDKLQQLSFSRELETEADRNAIMLMSRNNIDTKGMLALVKILKAEEGDAEAVNFLSTHPISSIRIENVEQFIKEYPNNTTTNNDNLKELFNSFKQSW